MVKLNLSCCVCKRDAEFVKELDNNKGFKFYCQEHFTHMDLGEIKELANMGVSSVRR
jgi:hypothetical protein